MKQTTNPDDGTALPSCLRAWSISPRSALERLETLIYYVQIPEPTALFIIICWIDQQVNDNGYDNNNTSSFAEQTHKPTIKIQTKHFPFFEHQLTELKFVDNQH